MARFVFRNGEAVRAAPVSSKARRIRRAKCDKVAMVAGYIRKGKRVRPHTRTCPKRKSKK